MSIDPQGRWDVGYCAHRIPSTLTTDKRLPASSRPRVPAEIDIAVELDDSRRGAAGRLSVERDVPHAGCRVLRVAIPAGIHEVLLGRRVRAHQRDEVMCIDCLGGEERQQFVGGVGLGGEESRGPSFGVVLAADERAYAWSERADHSRDVGAELDEVGLHSSSVLE